MSSFKRKIATKENPPSVGTRALPGPITTFITSTGVPSLDDILGGGLPLTCDILVLAPDVHSAYGELLQKYFIAQGLASGQDVCIIDDYAQDFVSECMWIPGGGVPKQAPPVGATDEDEDDEAGKEFGTKIKIAWRYEQLKQFQTTVNSSSQENEEYCKVFDLTAKIPISVLDASHSSNQLKLIEVTPTESSPSAPFTHAILSKVENLLGGEENDPAAARKPLRLCIPSLGSPQWGDLTPHDICSFLHTLRATLRRYPHAIASISLAPHLCAETWGGPGWTQKLGWLSDTCISLSAFSANPALTAMFPAHHGFVHVHSLPAPHSLQAPSDKFSTLRGLTSSGENNLAFKCMRKRIVFETLHLDLEGGVGERRTTPSATATALEDNTHHHVHSHPTVTAMGEAAVEVSLEEATEPNSQSVGEVPVVTKKAKPKKKVAFHSDRPDLYDF
ncbi:PAXNEB-domain-containing protein [Cristinia sonorae]|uniref:Elongator complex protein 4 n=1 Tax=Cristinia sonorae TaxID=1940300 RepID=A0A8K0XRF7_9AGAR|nr:PAXNEB-domain-containing protein [Cristinia sonorae]